MKGIILDSLKENIGECYLCKVSLGDYVASLPNDYKEYDIQREIVKNIYLDNLIKTVLEKGHIPPIVLVVTEKKFKINGDGFEAEDYKILDGLQRTFRLKTIFDTVDLIKKELKLYNLYDLNILQISRTYKERLDKINSSTSIFSKIILFLNDNKQRIEVLDEIFEKSQWFEIWTGLTPEQEVAKMLVLNAGHKPVKTKHQLELLFLNILSRLEKIRTQEFVLRRDKEISSNAYSKERKVGEYYFSHLITSILSFAEGRPLTTNIDLVQKKQSDYFKDEIFDYYMSYEFLTQFIECILVIDKVLENKYGADGVKWFGRETSLVGISAATGKYVLEQGKTPFQALERLKNLVSDNPEILNLKDFEQERNSLDLAKVNIGSINKRAIFNGIYNALTEIQFSIDWKYYFAKQNEN
jgi:hypothetical protein